MYDLVSKLSEMRSEYNCFDEDEEPKYRALSEAIKILSKRADGDTISRSLALKAISRMFAPTPTQKDMVEDCLEIIENLPSTQLEPLSDAYKKAVWTWLLDYQIKASELEGRYTPYEVLSWVANDWRKDNG